MHMRKMSKGFFIYLLGFLMIGLWKFGEMSIEIVSEEVLENNDTAVSISELNSEKCFQTRAGCCSEMDFGDINLMRKCVLVHKDKIPDDKDKADAIKVVKFLSCVIECVYKTKKYLGRGNSINMVMVKKDADKMYRHNPPHRDYIVEMYTYCGKEASSKYTILMSNPAGKIALKDACKVYPMLVLACTADYHKKYNCPYFKWVGKSESKSEKDCADAQTKCYEILDIPE